MLLLTSIPPLDFWSSGVRHPAIQQMRLQSMAEDHGVTAPRTDVPPPPPTTTTTRDESWTERRPPVQRRVIPMDFSRHDARAVRRQSRLIGRNWERLCVCNFCSVSLHRGYARAGGGGLGPLRSGGPSAAALLAPCQGRPCPCWMYLNPGGLVPLQRT